MCVWICVWVHAWRGQKEGLDTLELEVWVAVSHLMWVLENLRSSVKEVIYTSILSSPINDKQMVQGLASAAFLEYPSLVPDAYGRQLKIICNSSSGDSLKLLASLDTCTHKQTHTLIHHLKQKFSKHGSNIETVYQMAKL